jgi:hypothetical protein
MLLGNLEGYKEGRMEQEFRIDWSLLVPIPHGGCTYDWESFGFRLIHFPRPHFSPSYVPLSLFLPFALPAQQLPKKVFSNWNKRSGDHVSQCEKETHEHHQLNVQLENWNSYMQRQCIQRLPFRT